MMVCTNLLLVSLLLLLLLLLLWIIDTSSHHTPYTPHSTVSIIDVLRSSSSFGLSLLHLVNDSLKAGWVNLRQKQRGL